MKLSARWWWFVEGSVYTIHMLPYSCHIHGKTKGGLKHIRDPQVFSHFFNTSTSPSRGQVVECLSVGQCIQYLRIMENLLPSLILLDAMASGCHKRWISTQVNFDSALWQTKILLRSWCQASMVWISWPLTLVKDQDLDWFTIFWAWGIPVTRSFCKVCVKTVRLNSYSGDFGEKVSKNPWKKNKHHIVLRILIFLAGEKIRVLLRGNSSH